jgi:hypothetical protein
LCRIHAQKLAAAAVVLRCTGSSNAPEKNVPPKLSPAGVAGQASEGPVLIVERQQHRGGTRDELKTEAGHRRVAIVPSLARALMRHRASTEHAADDALIFPSLAGTAQDDHNVRRRLRPAAKRAGVQWATPHVFRHSLATELRDAGYDATVISKVLGHTDEAFTRRVYIHTRDAPRFDPRRHVHDRGKRVAGRGQPRGQPASGIRRHH